LKQLSQNISTGVASVNDVPAPVVAKGQILVRVAASLISAGTERMVVEFAEKNVFQKALARPDLVKQLIEKSKRDGFLATLEAARTRLDSDMVLGYSNAGVVIEVGDGVTEFKVGDRVACAGGGFASHSEIVRIPRNLAANIPQGAGFRDVSFEEAAFATVAAISLQGIRLAELQLGEFVAVLGLGLIGQIVVQLARANGCTVIGMDPSPDRCRLAERMGCLATVSSDEEMKALAARSSNGRGADVVLIAAATESSGPVTLAAEIARDRGKVIAVGAVGMSLPRKPYYMKELEFRVSRSYGPGRYDPEYEDKGRDYPLGYVRWTEGRNLACILQLLAQGKLDFTPLITHRFPIEQANKGYELIAGKTGEPFLGVVITYSDRPSLSRRIDLDKTQTRLAAGSEVIRIGLIGAGNFATATLIPVLKAAAGIELVGVCAAGGTSAYAAAARNGFRYCASDTSELFDDPSINTIAICTGHSSHASQVIRALQADKHVFCEKPLAMNEEELALIVQAHERASQRLLLVGYNRRFAPLAKVLKGFFSAVCEPFVMHYRVNAGYIPPEHWVQDHEQGGGRILGEVCHFVDFLSYLCGGLITSVSALVMPDVGRYSGDNVIASLRFGNGSIGTITYSANGDKSFSKERLEVFAEGRVGALDDFRKLRTSYNGKQRTTKSRLRVDKGHKGEWQAFADAIRTGRGAPISFPELVNSTLASIALLRTCADGSTVDVDTDNFLTRARAGHYSVTEPGG
jgi:predicted dehydrogenase